MATHQLKAGWRRRQHKQDGIGGTGTAQLQAHPLRAGWELKDGNMIKMGLKEQAGWQHEQDGVGGNRHRAQLTL